MAARGAEKRRGPDGAGTAGDSASEWPSITSVPVSANAGKSSVPGCIDGFHGAAFQWAYGRCLGELPLLPHFADKTNTLARQGFDQALLGSAVPDGTACGVDARAQRQFGHDAAAPDRFDQIIPADDVLAVADQVDQEVEDLGLHGNDGGAGAQLAPVRVERVIVEKIK